MQKILGKLRRAIQDFNMIQEGDVIGVGVSGGKDSITLLYGLSLLKKFYPVKFDVIGLMITMGYDDFKIDETVKFCSNNNIPFFIKGTDIKKIVFDYRQEKNPCSLCANMRRGALNNFALEKGCNKVALAHHYNDLIETLIMSLFYNGRLSTFEPVTYLERTGLSVIRPLIYIKEKEIKIAVRKNCLPVVKNPCPVDGYTTRQYVKDLLINLKKTIPDIDKHIFTAIKKDVFHYKD